MFLCNATDDVDMQIAARLKSYWCFQHGEFQNRWATTSDV